MRAEEGCQHGEAVLRRAIRLRPILHLPQRRIGADRGFQRVLAGAPCKLTSYLVFALACLIASGGVLVRRMRMRLGCC